VRASKGGEAAGEIKTHSTQWHIHLLFQKHKAFRVLSGLGNEVGCESTKRDE
jgi:hypothetical protein